MAEADMKVPGSKIFDKDGCNQLQWEAQSVFMAKIAEKVLTIGYDLPIQVTNGPHKSAPELTYHSIQVGDAAIILCNGQFNDFELYQVGVDKMVTHSQNLWTIVNRILQAKKRHIERAKHEEERKNRPDYKH